MPGSSLQGSVVSAAPAAGPGHFSMRPQPPQFQVTAPSVQRQDRALINSHITPASHTRQEQTFQDGHTTTNITHETKREQIGDTTFTQRTTQRVSHTNLGPGMASPRRSPSPLAPQSRFQMSNFGTSAPKPAMWTPSSNITVSGPSNVSLTQYPDKTITMSIGVPLEESKENIAPKPQAPLFKVSKVAVDQPKGIWMPGGMAPAAPRPVPQREPSPRMEMPQSWAPPAMAPPPPQPRQPTPPPADLDQDVSFMPSDFRTSGQSPMHVDVSKLIREPRESECSTPESPGTIIRRSEYIVLCVSIV